MKKIAAVLVSVIMLCAPASAYAACVQSDLAGAWQLYHTIGAVWHRCAVVIRSGGAMDSAGCRISGNAVTQPLTDGRATLVSHQNCVFTASYKVGELRFDVEHATLSRDKQTAAGGGSFTGDYNFFTINMIKR
jgi:hypothetical protein